MLYGKENNSRAVMETRTILVVIERITIILTVLERRTVWRVYFYFMKRRTILALAVCEKKKISINWECFHSLAQSSPSAPVDLGLERDGKRKMGGNATPVQLQQRRPLPHRFKRAQGGSKIISTQFMFRSRNEDTTWFTDDNPTTFDENVNGKGKVDNCYAEFEGRETLSKAAILWRAWSMA
jgi:hypothetical protein